MHRLFSNALIQPLFQYVCTAWFSKFSKILELPLQVSQNKCMRFCLHLDKRSKICVKRFLQLAKSSLSPISLNFTTITVQTNLMNFSVLLVKIVSKTKKKIGIQSLSYVGPNTSNSLPGNLKSATSVNSF